MSLEPITELMAHARKNEYAIGYFESWNIESLQGVIDAAEQTRSPIIIGFNGEFLSDSKRRAEERLSWYGALGKAAAESARVPCGFIFNECPNVDWVLNAVTAGFNLVMPADAKAKLAEYQQKVQEIVEYAHAHEVAVEAEIDELPFGDEENILAGSDTQLSVNGVAVAPKLDRSIGTNPQIASKFVAETKVDLLAISVGNVHVKLNGRSDLDLERIANLRQAIEVPLVLHGGTGISDASLREAVALGVAKVNFGSYLKLRYLAAVRNAIEILDGNPHAILGRGGPEDAMVAGRHAVLEAVLERIDLLGCCGKA